MGKQRAKGRATGPPSRGKGQRSGGKGSTTHGEANSGFGPTDQVQRRPTEVVLHLTAANSFFEASPTATVVNTAKVEAIEPGSGSYKVTLINWSIGKVRNLAQWFRKGLAGDASAVLKFPPSLSKEDRKLVHEVSMIPGTPLLDSLSQGVGDQRHILLLADGSPLKADAQVVLEGKEDHKAKWIYQWARDAGIGVSVGEVREMIKNDTLTQDLQELWATKSAAQKAVMALCGAIANTDNAALKAAIEEAPDAVRAGTFAVDSRVAPLHFAAAKGNIAALNLLLEAGAPVNQVDGHGKTALDVSRKEEQCEAEGVLLRAGAYDPLAAVLPVVAPQANSVTPKDEIANGSNDSLPSQADAPPGNANGHVETSAESSLPSSSAEDGPTESVEVEKAQGAGMERDVSHDKETAGGASGEGAGQNGSASPDEETEGSAGREGAEEERTTLGTGHTETSAEPGMHGHAEVPEGASVTSGAQESGEDVVSVFLASKNPPTDAGPAEQPLAASAVVEASEKDTDKSSELRARPSLDERCSAVSAESVIGSTAYLEEGVPDAASADDPDSDADIPTTPRGPVPDDATIEGDVAGLAASLLRPASPSSPLPHAPATPALADKTGDAAEPLGQSAAERASVQDAEDRDGALFDGASSTGAYAATGSICGVSDLGSAVNSDGEEGSALEEGASPRRDRSLKGLPSKDAMYPAIQTTQTDGEVQQVEKGGQVSSTAEPPPNVCERIAETTEIVADPLPAPVPKKTVVESPFQHVQEGDKEEGSLWSILGLDPPSSSTLLYAGIAVLGVGLAAMAFTGPLMRGKPRFR